MQEEFALETKTKEELKQIATELGIKKISAMKKAELIEKINEARSAVDTNNVAPGKKRTVKTTIKEKRKERTRSADSFGRDDVSENIENVAIADSGEEPAEEKKEEKTVKRERPDGVIEVCGILDIMVDGFGFLRTENFRPSENDIYVSPTQIRRFNLKQGDEIRGDARPTTSDDKFSPLLFVKQLNGDGIDAAFKRRPFEKLTPIYPKEKLRLDTGDRINYAARLIDIIAPIGKGQRGMIVAPPKAGKTTIIKQIARAIAANYPDVKLIVLLIDERPEEVTDIKRSVNGDVIYSTFDQTPENHCRVSEMVLERASRLVEQHKDVVILMDSITRLARAYNLTVTPTGRTLSGGLDPDALIKPKKFFGAARNIEEGGSLTIIATALVETGSRMDEVIFEEFKGTGNMELKLDRSLQERRIFPAIDILKSGTRREEDLLTNDERHASWIIRRELAKGNFADSTRAFLEYLKKTEDNKKFTGLLINHFGKK